MKEQIRITFVGDLMCQKEQSKAARQRHGTYHYHNIFAGVRHLFHDSDLVIGNLETPLAGEADGFSMETFRFNTPDSFVEAVRDAGINFVSIANNHILDRGIAGLERTIRVLHEYSVGHTGAYSKPKEAEEIEIREIGGLKIAILAFTYGTNSEFYGEPLPSDQTWRVDLLRAQSAKPTSQAVRNGSRRPLKYYFPLQVRMALSALAGKKTRSVPGYIADNVTPDQIQREIDLPFLARTKEKILRARELADIVIVLPHMGGQYNPAPGSYTRHMAEWISRLGPDAMIANHPHVPLGCQVDDRCLTAYSLGNFCFNPSDGCFVPSQYADHGIVLHLDLCTREKRILSASFQVTRTVVEPDGFALVRSVSDDYRDANDILVKERIMVDNEAVVNRFRGGYANVAVQSVYELPAPTTRSCHTTIAEDF
jgi:poly-gamma-glutamate synthesis protein (capsule biosynthesis protein)